MPTQQTGTNGRCHPGDYQRIAAAIEFIRIHRLQQPGLSDVAAAVNLSEFHLQRLFTRWAGISPKRFLQYLTIGHAKDLLAGTADILSASLDAGLSGPGRLHDLFVTLEAVTPGEYKSGGKGLLIRYGRHGSPFGDCFIGQTERGVCFLEFMAGEPEGAKLTRLRYRWPEAAFIHDQSATADMVAGLFGSPSRTVDGLHLLVRGTNFQIQVWQALLRIPRGGAASYADIAKWIGRPTATRAVGSAVGANPIAWIIPCHRVLRSDGELGGYHWGRTRKQACLVWEAAHLP